MKRACIFFFYDNDGIADDYIFYNLNELKTVSDYLLVVINGKLTPESRDRFADIADDMFVRQNTGFDTWAYKDGISFIGWKGLEEYDELIMLNHTIYGPLRPLKEVFGEMEGISCDFWGLNRGYEDKENRAFLGKPVPMGHKPEFVSSNFRVIRKKMLGSVEFRRYWDELPSITNYWAACIYGEWQFSYDMINSGFTFYTLDKGGQRGLSRTPTIHEAYDQISRLRVPYFRKKLFDGSTDEFNNYRKCSEPERVMNYVKNCTDYDPGLIYKNILRTNDQYDIFHRLALTKILPKYEGSAKSSSKTAVIFHCYFPELFPKYTENLMCFPKGTDMYFTVCSEELEKTYKALTKDLEKDYRLHFIRTENRGRDIAALLVGAGNIITDGGYDYICFMHEKRCETSLNQKFKCISNAYSDTSFDNTATTPEYVSNVINLLDNNPQIGIASAPAPTHWIYYTNIDGNWGRNFNAVKELLDKKGVNVPISPIKPPSAPYGNVFWFRPAALAGLVNSGLSYEDFPEEPAGNDGTLITAMERALSYFAQAEGFCSAVIMNNIYAEQEFIYYSQALKRYHNISVKCCGRKSSSAAQINALEKIIADNNEADVKSRRIIPSPVDTLDDESVYVKLSRSPFKDFIKKIVPHSLWEALRKKKCEKTGELYIKI